MLMLKAVLDEVRNIEDNMLSGRIGLSWNFIKDFEFLIIWNGYS